MLASVPAGRIRYTLGAATGELTATPEIDIINDTCRSLENARSWSFLEHRSQQLSLVRGEPFIKLPSDFRDVIAIESNPSVINQLTLSTYAELLQLRTSTIQSWGGFYRAAVFHHVGLVKNLASFTEAFDTGATWVAVLASVTADQAVGPAGEAAGSEEADEITASAAGGGVRAVVAASNLEAGHDYVFSVYLKQSDTLETKIQLEQLGAGAGNAATRLPKTTLKVTWSATGVATSAVFISQGDGLHEGSVISEGDGWYRAYVSLTWDAAQAMGAESIAMSIFPDSLTGTNSAYVWGAQLEDVELHEHPVPTAYEGNAGAYAAATGDVERRLAIWPTPTVNDPGNFSMFYRAKLPTIAAEADVIPIPDYVEPVFNEMAVIMARGYNEEDVAHTHDRLNALRSSVMWEDAVTQDQTSQVDFGPLRGTAASTGSMYRNWGSWETIPNPT
jgi:hypothetical protein